MSVPDRVRHEVREALWGLADHMDWAHMSPQAKAAAYENWSRHPDFGGRLGRYIDPRRVRTYLKNSIMGGYGRHRLADERKPFRVLGIEENTPMVERYRKPHGVLLEDGRTITWGRATSWRNLLLSLHERTFGFDGLSPFGMVLFRATGRYREERVRAMVEDAASKIGVERTVWLES